MFKKWEVTPVSKKVNEIPFFKKKSNNKKNKNQQEPKN